MVTTSVQVNIPKDPLITQAAADSASTANINAFNSQYNTPAPAPAPTPPNYADQLAQAKTQLLGIQSSLNAGLTPEPTIGETFANPEYQKSAGFTSTQLTDQENRDIERAQLRLFQKEIDATNQIYDQMLNESRMEGQGRLGSQRAMAARGGLLGSDFGAAQKEKVLGYNSDINRAVQAERVAKIGGIMGTVRTAVAEQKAAKRLAKQQDANEYLAYLKNESTLKEGNINLAARALLSQGFNPAEMTEDELGAIALEAGTTPQNLLMAYQQLAAEQASATAETDLKTRKTEAEISKLNADATSSGYFNLSEGQSRYDAQGNLIASKGKTYAPGTGGGKGVTSGSLSLTDADIGEGAQKLNASRGADGYVDSQLYADMLSFFADQGGLVQDFVKTYPADLYLNPQDPTVKNFIKTELQRDSTDELTKLLFGGA